MPFHTATSCELYIKQMPGAEVYSLTQNESLKLAAEKLAEIHLAFWQGRSAYANALQQLHGSSMLTRRQQAYKNSCSRKAWKDFSDKVMERLQDVPKTLIHGDLFPSNILIDEQNVCFVDWADAAISARYAGYRPVDRHYRYKNDEANVPVRRQGHPSVLQ